MRLREAKCTNNSTAYIATSLKYRKRRKFGGIKVWRISKEINLAEESLVNFSTYTGSLYSYIAIILAICWQIKFGEISQFAKLWSLQTFVVYGSYFL